MNTQAPKYFISYARKDGREVADDLRQKLEAAGFDIWQDVVAMEGGEKWWQQIKEAIEGSAVMILVLTDGALASGVVHDEWSHARTVGTHIMPITLKDEIFELAPAWIKKVDVFILKEDHPDYEKTWERFLNQLKNPPERKARPFTVPNLPVHFVNRPNEFGKLVGHLLDTEQQNPVAITTALQGGGGFGKTTLAIALCRDEKVRVAFDDGILWLQFRESTNQNDVLSLLNEQIKLLVGESDFGDVTSASARFGDLLKDRDVLVVLDDVWNESYLRYFIFEGTGYLITSRLQTVVSKARAESVAVDELQSDEAQDLLAKWLDDEPDEGEKSLLADLAKRLGEWALLLELVGAELRSLVDEGHSLREAIEHVTKRLDRRGVTYLDIEDEENRNLAIGMSLDASVSRLKEAWQSRFYELAIFPEDTAIPFKTIEQLWGEVANYDDLDTEDALKAMNRLSLFTRYDVRDKTLRLHDVVRQVIAARLDNPTDLHEKLIAAWGELKNLPDTYAWQNIAYHLVSADQKQTLYDLVTQDKTWVEKKFVVTKADLSCLNDIDYAISTFNEPLDADSLIQLINLYSVRQIIFERTLAIINDELKILVWQGEEERALQYVRQRRDPNSKVAGLRAIYLAKRHLNQTDISMLDEVAKVALSIIDAEKKSHALITIADDFLEADMKNKAQHIIDRLSESMNWVEEQRDYRANWILRRLCILLVKQELFEEAEYQLSLIDGDGWYVEALAGMAKEYHEKNLHQEAINLIEKALGIACDYTHRDIHQANMLHKITKTIIDIRANQFLKQALTEFEKTAYEVAQSNYVSPLSSLGLLAILLFQIGEKNHAKQIIKAIEASNHESKNTILADIYAQAEEYEQALEIVHGMPIGEFKGDRLRLLVAKTLVKKEQFEQAEKLLEVIQDEGSKAELLQWLAYFQGKSGNLKKAQIALDAMKESRLIDNSNRNISDAQLECVKALIAAKKYTDARKLAALMTDELEMVKAYHWIALFYHQNSMLDEYHEMLAEADKIVKNKTFSRIEKAEEHRVWVYLLTNKFDEAESIISELSEQSSKNWLRRLMISLYAEKGEFEKAGKILNESPWRGLFVELVTAYCKIAFYTYKSNQIEISEKYFQKALDIAGKIPSSYILDNSSSSFHEISKTYANLLLFEEAKSILEHISEPTCSNTKRIICEIMAYEKRFLEAEELANTIENDSSKSLALGLIASELHHNGDVEKSKKLYTEAHNIAYELDKEKNRLDTMQNLAIAYVRSKQFTKAFHYIQAQNIDEYITTLAKWCDAFNEFDEDLSEYVLKEAIRIAAWYDPNWSHVYNQLS